MFRQAVKNKLRRGLMHGMDETAVMRRRELVWAGLRVEIAGEEE